ncbi:MAG: hypothetical protein ACOC41_03635 [Chitinivibrionales bacterium]
MALKKIQTQRFIYISYARESFKELTLFKNTMANIGSLAEEEKDVILDLSGTDCISSPEIGAIAALVKRLYGSNRFVRIIADEATKHIMDTTNIGRIKNVVIYGGLEEFRRKMKASAKQA